VLLLLLAEAGFNNMERYHAVLRMSHDRTHVEIRNAEVHRELIEITEEMRSAMQVAFEADAKQFAVDEKPPIDDRRNNFRPYDQRQRFFVDVSKDSFLEEKHPARIIDLVVEGLDLSEVYGQYSDEGNRPYQFRVITSSGQVFPACYYAVADRLRSNI